MRTILRRLTTQRGGVALIMLVGFIGLAVPITIASIQTSAQLSRNSRVYDSRLRSMYGAGSGIEVAIWQILTDAGYYGALTPSNPSAQLVVDTNGDTVEVTINRIFTGGDTSGQGLVVTKTVSPSSAPPNILTTFTYNVRVQNEGTGTADIERIWDYLPPRFAYVPGSARGLTTSAPFISDGEVATCGATPKELRWDLEDENLQVGAGEELTLTFEAWGTLPDGTYYNQAKARYEPSWDDDDLEAWTPYTAEVTVGSGDPKCGHGMDVLVKKSVDPDTAQPGVPTEFTYTISVENVASEIRYVCRVEDLLPPGYTYVSGSSEGYAGNLSTSTPEMSWQSDSERWRLRWQKPGEEPPPITGLAPGESRTQVLKATATLSAGATYYNDAYGTWSTDDPDECEDALEGEKGGITAAGAAVEAPVYFDVSTVASNGTVQARVLLSWPDGTVEIVSWQQQ
ncbi:MAG: DUF11 domain-containing protein [Chloroflexi bacterium]|nr:DUF11 domain-containing protein [Chloroflexota bacterium]